MIDKRKFIIAFLIILIIFIVLYFNNGFKKRADVILMDYSVLENGSVIKLDIGISASIGYVRSLKLKQKENSIYITFYSTFGFFNNKMGSKGEYEIKVNPKIDKIYFYKGDEKYNLVLQKNELTNEWEFAN